MTLIPTLDILLRTTVTVPMVLNPRVLFLLVLLTVIILIFLPIILFIVLRDLVPLALLAMRLPARLLLLVILLPI
jgi:hypothetical protein